MTDTLEAILGTVSVERLAAHIRALEGVRHPVTAPAALAAAVDYVENRLRSLGYDVCRHPFQDGGLEYYNLVGSRPGSRCPAERVMVLAHMDTVSTSPGADDNASGIAALLELAELLRRFRFERTVDFVAVNLEERWPEDKREESTWLRGSSALAAQARAADWAISGVAVLETVAFAGDDIPQQGRAGLPIAVPEHGNFLAVIGNEASAGTVQAFMQGVSRFHVALPCVPLIVPGQGEVLPASRRSDHAPFWDCDYPAFMLTDTADFRNPHYHRPTDTLDTLNLPFLAKVCQATGAWVAEMAGSPDEWQWT